MSSIDERSTRVVAIFKKKFEPDHQDNGLMTVVVVQVVEQQRSARADKV